MAAGIIMRHGYKNQSLLDRRVKSDNLDIAFIIALSVRIGSDF